MAKKIPTSYMDDPGGHIQTRSGTHAKMHISYFVPNFLHINSCKYFSCIQFQASSYNFPEKCFHSNFLHEVDYFELRERTNHIEKA